MKDWKGNKNAMLAQKGIRTDYTTKGRQDVDFYATNPKALEMLLDHSSTWLQSMLDACKKGYSGKLKCLDKNNIWRKYFPNHIWECAVGTGNLCKVLEDRGYWNVYTDLIDRGYGKYRGMYGIDFLKEKKL